MSELAEFFRKKREGVAQLESHKEKMLGEWLEALNSLIRQLEQWLEPALAEGLKIEPYQKEITEYDLGTYQAPALEVSFGSRKMRIEPVARFIVGGTGRVDIDSSRGIFKLIRDPATGSWFLVRRTLAEAEPLAENSFSRLIQEIFA
ncbi:MAG: hypothetical protein K6T71_03580 [Candidatus Bipolaricaulota bacterium]|nr:hypothetical protein [Candidatus Bipolaricaulota bacterium]